MRPNAILCAVHARFQSHTLPGKLCEQGKIHGLQWEWSMGMATTCMPYKKILLVMFMGSADSFEVHFSGFFTNLLLYL